MSASRPQILLAGEKKALHDTKEIHRKCPKREQPRTGAVGCTVLHGLPTTKAY